ncbi:MAG: hypothetical protein F4199_01455 [Rhodothermaceae bacterium]|nr:hypothetical protein [Rhodothermaceae bacterium]
MNITDEQIRQRLTMGEDGRWEFKQIEFNGDEPKSPRRDDLADEMGAFANVNGGIILCGVSDNGELQGMSEKQAAGLSQLLAEVSTDAIEPPLRIDVNHRQLDGKLLVLVEVPKGDFVYGRAGHAYLRIGPTKRPIGRDERLRLDQRRGQSRYIWFDQQAVPNTGFHTLVERLWEPLISAPVADDPRRALTNLRLLTSDIGGVDRATVAGVLLCTDSPQELLPQATIMATMYRGKDRASAQLDAQEIEGPLSTQITDAVKFVARNMRVAARKTPAREDVPQYSLSAVFEAIVNAVVHRDYSMTARRIRISMFKDRLEIDSPGLLPNGMTIDGMNSSQATRNEVLASIFGRISVGNIPGSKHRKYIMERRGNGVPIILEETKEIVGIEPEYRVIDETNLVLTIPAARLDLIPSKAIITVHSGGEPMVGADILALFPNKTWQQGKTDENGEADLNLYTTHLPMTVYAAMPGYTAGLAREWVPSHGGLLLQLDPRKDGGAVIFPRSTGHIPGLDGRLNPIRDTLDRTYLYADNVAVDEGKQQPVTIRLGKPLRLTDAYGAEIEAKIVDITGRSSLIEYGLFDS